MQCDGQRPSCSRCAKKGAVCVYDVEADTSRARAIRAKNDALTEEIEQLRELMYAIRSRPEAEAQELFRRLRITSDPLDVARSLRDGDLLLQHSSPVSMTAAPAPGELEELDRNALRESAVKVSARPWTWLAGDGLVSELISSFFTYDATFRFPFVDQECFLKDMHARDVDKAQFCSPLLVVAMCAMRSVGNALLEVWSTY